MTETKVRYGILSAATIVPRFAKGMRLTSNGEVTAIAARSLSKAKETARELDIPNVYPDYASLLESDEVDAVYIPLVNSLHYEYAEKALKAGKHAIVEKPFVLHAADAEKLFETASEKGLFITEAIKTPHLPLYQKIKQIVDSEKYGRIRMSECIHQGIVSERTDDLHGSCRDRNPGLLESR